MYSYMSWTTDEFSLGLVLSMNTRQFQVQTLCDVDLLIHVTHNRSFMFKHSENIPQNLGTGWRPVDRKWSMTWHCFICSLLGMADEGPYSYNIFLHVLFQVVNRVLRAYMATCSRLEKKASISVLYQHLSARKKTISSWMSKQPSINYKTMLNIILNNRQDLCWIKTILKLYFKTLSQSHPDQLVSVSSENFYHKNKPNQNCISKFSVCWLTGCNCNSRRPGDDWASSSI